MMEYRYRVNPNMGNTFLLQDIPIRMEPGKDYNLDARCNGDAREASGELRQAIYQNWVQRVEYIPPKVKKVKPLPVVKPVEDTPIVEGSKAEKVLDTAIDLNAVTTTKRGKLRIASKSGNGWLYFIDRNDAIRKLTADEELLKHLQKLCQG